MDNNGKVAEASERIELALFKKGMKQIDLAALTGISKQSINCYLSGKYEPKQTALYKMAKALDVSEMWLAGYDVPKERTIQQKENDLIDNINTRMAVSEDYRQLILKMAKLNDEQLQILEKLVDML